MKIIKTIKEMQDLSKSWQKEGYDIGFVPTMGYLHAGHMSLVNVARQQSENLKTVVSIFVNPTQFGPNEDLDKYPRDFERDEKLCREAGVDAIFYPTNEMMYADNHSTWVVEDTLSLPLCAKSRPIHFRGVTTVVSKLFLAVLPDFAVFGQKDAQQSLIIKRMVRDLNFPIKIIIGDIIREEDGLAMSSRNKYLSPEERKNAPQIYQALLEAQNMLKNGINDCQALIKTVSQKIITANAEIDYVEILSADSLQPVSEVNSECLLAIAAKFGKTRLIDNCFLRP